MTHLKGYNEPNYSHLLSSIPTSVPIILTAQPPLLPISKLILLALSCTHNLQMSTKAPSSFMKFWNHPAGNSNNKS